MADVEFNTAALDRLIKSLQKTPTIKVGVLGNSSRTGTESNATIGAAHEFGTSRMARRSFLLEPLKDELGNFMERHETLDEDTFKEVLKTGSLFVWMKRIASIAEAVVLEAFHTGGFGKWVPWKNGYSSTTGQILVESQQLMRSIASEVKDA